jgi:hypothetical protein
MHSGKIAAFSLLVALIAPAADAHRTRHHARAAATMCGDMHSKMHPGRPESAGAMKCMADHSARTSGAPAAGDKPSATSHNHDHSGAQPPK